MSGHGLGDSMLPVILIIACPGFVCGFWSICSLHQLHRKLPGTVAAIQVSSNQIVRITCQEGYFPRDAQVLGCEAGNWNSTGECTAISCGQPPPLSNGSVRYSKTIFGAVAVYACGDGFILDGPGKRICSANSTWDGDVQTCALPPPVSRSGVIAIIVISALLFVVGVVCIAAVEVYRRRLFPNSVPRSKCSNASSAQFSAREEESYSSAHHNETVTPEAIEPYAQTRRKLINTRTGLYPGVRQPEIYAEINDSDTDLHSSTRPYAEIGTRVGQSQPAAYPYAEIGVSPGQYRSRTRPYAEIGTHVGHSQATAYPYAEIGLSLGHSQSPTRPYAEIGVSPKQSQPSTYAEISEPSDPLYESLDVHTQGIPSRQHLTSQQSPDILLQPHVSAYDFTDVSQRDDVTDAAIGRIRPITDDADFAPYTAPYTPPYTQKPVSSHNTIHTLSPAELDKLYAKPQKRKKKTNFTVI